MVLLVLTYIVGFDEVDDAKDMHMEYIAEAYRRGEILMSGPRVPREGGVVLLKTDDPAVAAEWAAGDPFAKHGVARYDVIPFAATSAAPDVVLEALSGARDPR